MARPVRNVKRRNFSRQVSDSEDDDGGNASAYGSDTGSETEVEEDNSGDEYELTASGRKRKRVVKPKALKQRKFELPYVAKVISTATQSEDSSSASKLESIDSSILARIRKAIDLASHAGTGENEAKQAMRMATKLMNEQNLTQADLIANESAEERKQRAGQSVVSITSKEYGTTDEYGDDLGKQVRNLSWYNTAVNAACAAFDVKCFSHSHDELLVLDWNFYGLADNTVAAALSFEMLHNQIMTWTIEQKKELKGAVASNNYKNGVAERVLKEARKEKHEEEKQAREEETKRLKAAEEEEQRKREEEIKRLSSIESSEREESTADRTEERKVKVEEVEDEEDNKKLFEDTAHEVKIKPEPADFDLDDLTAVNENFANGFADPVEADFDDDNDDGDIDMDVDALEDKIKFKQEHGCVPSNSGSPSLDAKPESVPPPEVKAEAEEFQPTWTSAMQLRTFRDNAANIADDFLKSSKTKVRKARKRKETKYDPAAFNKGWEDGKKVDLKRRKIEGAEQTPFK